MEKRDLTLDNLQSEIEKLLALLKDRQQGMVSWHMFLNERLHNLHLMLDMSGIKGEETVFSRMLSTRNFDRVNENITHENFPIVSEPAESTEYVFVHLNKAVSTEEAEAEIKKRGLVSGDLADLLFYVRKNPDEQKRYPIVALGSRWRNSYGYWSSPFADCWSGERFLNLNWRGYDWVGCYRFLACKPACR